MGLSRQAGIGISGKAGARGVALLAVLTILLQAVVFAWHHHPLAATSSQSAVTSIEKPSGPQSSKAEDEACAICQVLHHQSAAPGELAAVAATSPVRSPLFLTGTLFLPGGTASGFHARAPPQA